jgi:hypothetical protein
MRKYLSRPSKFLNLKDKFFDADMSSGAPTLSPEQGIELLKGQIEKVRKVSDWRSFQHWVEMTNRCIEAAFGKDHENLTRFTFSEEDR